jgi:hypothetical protein
MDPLDITAYVLDDVALVPASMYTPGVDAEVLGGAVVIQMLSPKLKKTFKEDVDLISFHTSSDSLKM